MPPKRKRTSDDLVTDASTATRATRSSTRASSSTVAAPLTASRGAGTKKVSSKKEAQQETGEAASAPKKPKVSKTSTKSTGRAAKGNKAAEQEAKSADKGDPLIIDDDLSEPRKTSSNEVPNPMSSLTNSVSLQPINPKTQPLTPANEPYTAKRSLTLFERYADHDDPTIIGPEGFEKLCSDANIPLDGALPLILTWQLGAKEMGKITAQEWNSGTESLKVSSIQSLSLAVHDLSNLLFLARAPSPKRQKEPYDKTALRKYSDDRKDAFHKLYSFCFLLAKPEQSKNIDMETAAALWSVLLVPKYPVMSEVIAFINENGTYRAANKDLWSMMLEFCETVNPNLSDYEGDGAWPTLLDDFVSWKKTSAAGGNPVIE